MPTPFYTADILDVDGKIVKQIEDIVSLQAARSFNTEGSATLVIPSYYDWDIFRMHTRVKLWRWDYRGISSNFGDTVWFLKKKDLFSSDYIYSLTLVDAFAMLNTRVVAYTAQTPYADKTLEEFALITYNDAFRADSMMLAYVRENFGDLALDSARLNEFIETERDRKQGPYGEKQAAWEQLGSVLSDLASQAAANGLSLYYDLIPTTNGHFIFRTWSRVRGVDRSSRAPSPLVLSDEEGMIDDIHEIEDYTDVATLCYALGYDSGPSQMIEEVQSPLLVRNDPFGRIEMTTNASDSDVPSVLTAVGQAALNGRRPKRQVTARVVENRALSYGTHLSYGDLLAIEVGGRQYDVAVSAVSVSWSEGEEELDIRLSGEEAIGLFIPGGPITPGVPNPGESNTAPVANAGPDQSDEEVFTFTLAGSGVDDGLPDPPATLTYLWTKVSGPGTATFVDATDPETDVTLSEIGTYVLRLTVSDSALSDSDEMTISISEPFVPPLPGDPDVYYGYIGAYVMWTSAHIYRTSNLQAASPVWELVDTGITGTIYSGQYIHVDADTIGMWLMTSTAIWWCADIQATTPSWSAVLTIATVRAADATPSVSLVHFKTMFPYWSAPGHLCVATGPLGDDGTNTTYQHAYFWVTENYGANWTQVDMNAFLLTSADRTRGYCYSSIYAMNIFRSAPGTIWCVRSTPIYVGLSKAHVFISSDLGYTWSQGVIVDQDSNNVQSLSLLNPFPDAADPSYATAGSVGGDNRVNLLKSTDGWVTKSTIADPSGYGGLSNLWRVNKRTFDNLHIMAWMRHTAEVQMHLMESNDGGATWTMLYDSGLSDTSISNTNTGNATGVVVNCSPYNTPNGWPPDVNQWVTIMASNAGAPPPTTNLIQLTLDNFATRLDKTGNLIAIGGAWAEGANDGFALPRVGANEGEASLVFFGEFASFQGVTDDEEVYTPIGFAWSATIVCEAEEIGSTSGVEEDNRELIIAPPPDTKRLKVLVEWEALKTRVGLASTASQVLTEHEPGTVTVIGDSNWVAPDYGVVGTGSGEVEWTFPGFAAGDWPINSVSIQASPPTTSVGCVIDAYCNADATSGSPMANARIEFTVTILEVELDDGTILTQ